jgi:hypothetical protein
LSVCGISNTENVSPETSFTVSETPSSATEPFCAMNRDSSGRDAQRELCHIGQIFPFDQFGNAVDVAADNMAAKLVAEMKRALEVQPGAGRPGAGGGHPQVSAAASAANDERLPVRPRRRPSGKSRNRRSRRRYL